MWTCHFQLTMKSKTECHSSMHRFIVKTNHLPLPSTVNLPLVKFVHILADFYHLPIRFVMSRHSLIEASEYTQVGISYTPN